MSRTDALVDALAAVALLSVGGTLLVSAAILAIAIVLEVRESWRRHRQVRRARMLAARERARRREIERLESWLQLDGESTQRGWAP